MPDSADLQRLLARTRPDLANVPLDPQANLAELGIDSIDLLSIVMQLAGAAGVALESLGEMKLETVNDVLALVSRSQPPGD